ncbi:MAG: hypothetical protein JWM80_1563, partial [Cyanobacteria bacterium RYN_339]|nr:hypothetical protein [Cyanobacteria bacterium RYN_339]
MLAPIRPSYTTPAPRPLAGGATPPNPYAAAPVAYQQQPVAYNPVTPAGQPTVANGLGQAVDNLMTLVGKVFTGIINFFKKLFGGNGGAAQVPGQAPVVPGVSQVPGQAPIINNPQLPAPIGQLGELSGQDAAIAQQQGIAPTKANFQAFMTEAQAIEQQQALGPGSTDTASITELQNLLKQWGYPVTPNGQFDQATIAAVLKFKTDNGLFASYRMANGQRGVHPFIDQATKQAMIAKLQGQPIQPSPGIASVPPVVNPAPAPIYNPAPAPIYNPAPIQQPVPQPYAPIPQPNPVVANVPQPVVPAPIAPPPPPPAPPVA